MGGVRQPRGDRARPAGEIVGAAGAVEHERLVADAAQQRRGDGVGDHAVVDERRRDRRHLRPRPAGDDLVGHAAAAQEPLDGVLATAGGDEGGQLAGERVRSDRVVVLQRRLEQRQPADLQARRGRVQGEQRAAGVAVEVGRAPGVVDQRGEVLDLAGGCVGRRVGALTTAAAVVGVDGEAAGQQRDEAGERAPPAVVPGRLDEDQRRPAPGVLEGDAGPVGGGDGHAPVSRPGVPASTPR